MSDIKKDLIEIEGILSSVSDYGAFEKRKDPEFLAEKCLYKQAQERLSRLQYACMQQNAVCQFLMAKMVAMVKNKPIDKTQLEAVEEQIAVFEENLKKGVYTK